MLTEFSTTAQLLLQSTSAQIHPGPKFDLQAVHIDGV